MPKVSIGFPVYNGEEFVSDAIQSLLDQTFTDFELVISDNASTDRTSEICRAFAARDKRIRYHRNERNIGGGPNQNQVCDMAAGAPYFKWAAHDDRHAPRFLERCVEVLDRDPGVMVAFGQVDLIDPAGKTIGSRKRSIPLDDPDALVRFKALFEPYDCLEVFGLIRRTALPRSPVMGLHADADGVFLARLALRGRFFEVPETLFFNRKHAGQATTRFTGDYRSWAAWWDPKLAKRWVFPEWRRQLEFWRSMLIVPMSASDRMRCVHALAQWTRWSRNHLWRDVRIQIQDLMRARGQ